LQTIQAIAATAREVAGASAEISGGTTNLSQHTEEQAATLEETSASMEEISATVKQNAENSQRANEFAAATPADRRSRRRSSGAGRGRDGADRGQLGPQVAAFKRSGVQAGARLAGAA
jgi:hypothetical protein